MARPSQTKLLKELGSRFRKIRKDRGLTQGDIAEALSIQDITVSRWERGDRAVSLATLAEAADALGVTLADLVGTATPVPSQGQTAWESEALANLRRMERSRRDLALKLIRELAKR